MESITNKTAHFEYEILDTYEAGLILIGSEVKSIRASRVQLNGSYIVIKGGELWLINAQIEPYQPKNMREGYDSNRARKLLLKKDELSELIGKTDHTNLTLIPLKLYNKNSRIKLHFGLARKKNKRDKRSIIKKKDIDREIART